MKERIVHEHTSLLQLRHFPFLKDKLLELTHNTLTRAKRLGADACEIVVNNEIGFCVEIRSGDVETLEHHQKKGLEVTIYCGQRTGTASTADLSLESVYAAVDKANTIAQYAGKDPYAGLADPQLLAFDFPDLELFHHWNITPAEAIQMAIECETIACEHDKRIKQSDGVTVATCDSFMVYGNSDNFIGYYPSSYHSVSCGVIAEEQEQMQRDYEYTVSRKPKELDELTFVAKKAAQKTIKRLGARKIKTQQCPVIFHAPVAKSLLGALVSAISGANLYRKSSFLLDQLQKPIFPKSITIYQQPHLLCGIGSAPFDSDGVKTHNHYYVKDGELVSYVLGSYSARKLGMKTTGNAGGVYNLSISNNNNEVSLMELFKAMDTGLLVMDLMGQGVNITTGDYSRGATGYWIEKGEIQYPVEEITIANNLKNMFSGIILVGNDVDQRGNIRTGSILIEKMTVAGN